MSLGFEVGIGVCVFVHMLRPSLFLSFGKRSLYK